jgi:hypothetical protein
MRAFLPTTWAARLSNDLDQLAGVRSTRLSLLARDDDTTQRPVTLLWRGSVATRMEPPNDEAAEGHRLYHSGLRDVVSWRDSIGSTHATTTQRDTPSFDTGLCP